MTEQELKKALKSAAYTTEKGNKVVATFRLFTLLESYLKAQRNKTVL